MLAILGGLGAALCWAAAVMASSRSSRRIGAWSTLAGVMLVGTIVTVPVAIATGAGVTFTQTTVVLIVISGVTNVAGLFLVYSAFRLGKVAVVAPIVSTEGAMGAVIAIVLGEQIALPVIAVLGTIALGVILASAEPSDDEAALETVVEPGSLVLSAGAGAGTAGTASGAPTGTTGGPPGRAGRRPFVADDRTTRTALIALTAAFSFGINLYVSARIGNEVSVVWSVLPARLLGTVGLALPLFVTGRLRITREALPFVVIAGLAEVIGVAVYAFGSRDGIAIASVTSSQFGALAAIASVVFFHERIRRLQVGGIILIGAGVALLAVLQAR